ncbi:N-acetylmuramoyl-L-alanine amidase [Williamsia deligens]|uniref:N-acetylmuramoyl-L-alanine amidase n=1 Tax=Williamsia deligens TaxID=321325 RepID=A0ABW3G263_9NOCA|nr:N-acetylmuramoyl-L-alanine amidase [Williamsia deligens]MCP2194909.1 N-acetylmuramoyl-L-alanine amidase [Williamsia deligens]
MTSTRFRSRTVSAIAGAAAVVIAAGVLTVPAVSAAPAAPAPAPAPAPEQKDALKGRTVFLDPGHQGSAAGHDLRKQVPNGRGAMKDCQTTGATGVNKAAEHTVNWDVVQLVKAGLESQGARVVLSRPDDTGWGGCVDERAAAANASKADIAVSVHADSTSATADPGKKGFHVIVPQLPVPDVAVQRAASTTGKAASNQMRDSFKAAGFPPANYAGVVDGLQTRADIAAVNLTRVPEVFVEMGNLSNPAEADQLASKGGQVKYAVALIDGIVKYLMATPASTALTPSLPQGSQNAPSSEAPQSTTPSTGLDLSGIQSLLPLITQIASSKDPSAIAALIQGQGSDAASDLLKSLLSVVYTAFGGKLPI